MARLKYIQHKVDKELFNNATRHRVTKLTAILQILGQPSTQKTARNDNVVPLSFTSASGIDKRHTSCDRGHLIAIEFGGPESPDNLVPMFGGFNTIGAWRQFEADVDTFAASMFGATHLTMVITIAYAGSDHRIPSEFKVEVETNTGFKRSPPWVIPHPRPQPTVSGADAALKLTYLQRIAEMDQLAWLIENQIVDGRRPNMPVVPIQRRISSVRPYAFLDYIDWLSVQNDVQGLDRWRNSFSSSGTSHFNSDQRAKIILANRILHDGYLKSDDVHDLAYTNIEYLVPGFEAGTLVEGDRDLAPEVDHIVALAWGGAAAYSNAQLLSGISNKQKSQRQDDANMAAALANVRKNRSGGLDATYAKGL